MSLRNLIQNIAGSGTGQSGGGGKLTTFPAHVLAVCMDENNELFGKGPANLGAVIFRDLSHDPLSPISEEILTQKDKGNIAYPIDRANTRYPYPGEQVLITIGIGEKKLANKGTVGAAFFYTSLIATNNNVTYNGQPFLNSGPSLTSANTSDTPKAISEKRLEAQIKDLSKVTTTNDRSKIYKQLRPYEGDFILQGRFGNTIRFGSTSAVEESVWSKKGSQGSGASGDPIMVLRVDRTYTEESKDMFVEENPDSDDSSIYLCSGQKVDLALSSTTKFPAWKNSFLLENDAEVDDKLRLKNKNKYKANNYAGPQVLITSERIILNARSSYLMLFGRDGVAINSPESVNIESDKAITLYGNGGVYLGVPNKGEKFPPASGNATYDAGGYEAVVLGNKLESLLSDLVQVIKNMKIIFSVEGSTLAATTQDKLTNIQAQLPEILSTTVFIDGVTKQQADPGITSGETNTDNAGVVGSTSTPITSEVGSAQPSNPVNTTPSQATNIPPQGSTYSETETISLYNDSI